MLNNVYILTESQCSSAKALFAAICLNLRNCSSSTGKMAKDGRAPSERMEAKITNCFVLASISHPYFFWFYFCFALFCFFYSPSFSLVFLFFSLVSIPHPLIFCLAPFSLLIQFPTPFALFVFVFLLQFSTFVLFCSFIILYLCFEQIG